MPRSPGWPTQNRPGEFWYPVTAETADWPLNDIKGQHVTAQDTWDALNSATGGSNPEGNVGGGTGMICNGFKGGTGTSSRNCGIGGYTVGVLVQCNYGGSQQLRVAGIPVAREMKLQKPCVEKKLDPPTMIWYGKPAPVCENNDRSSRWRARTGDGLDHRHRGHRRTAHAGSTKAARAKSLGWSRKSRFN